MPAMALGHEHRPNPGQRPMISQVMDLPIFTLVNVFFRANSGR
jgi:hypothetical protein